MKSLFLILTICFFAKHRSAAQDLMLVGEHYRLPAMTGDIFDSEYIDYGSKNLKIMLQKNINITNNDTIISIRFQDKLNRFVSFLDYDEVDNVIKGIDYIRFQKIYKKSKTTTRSIIYTRNGMAFGMTYSINKPNDWETFILFDWRKPDPFYLVIDDFSNISESLKKIRKDIK